MAIDDHKAVVCRLYDDVFNHGRLALLAELVARDFVDHTARPGVRVGPEGICTLVAMLRTAFPDNRHVIEDMIAEEDMLAVRLTFSGTHTGSYWGVAPTGRHFAQEQMHVFRFVNGKGVEHWAVCDDLSMLHQLRVIPGTPSASLPSDDAR